jgi:sorbitol-specific phosphotransferase system component IIBC
LLLSLMLSMLVQVEVAQLLRLLILRMQCWLPLLSPLLAPNAVPSTDIPLPMPLEFS